MVDIKVVHRNGKLRGFLGPEIVMRLKSYVSPVTWTRLDLFLGFCTEIIGFCLIILVYKYHYIYSVASRIPGSARFV
jgi:hypothetical protein